MYNVFNNRDHAGLLLSERLEHYKNNSNALVLAIPRGGIPIGHQLATRLNLPLDVILTKKIGHPDNREYAIGSVSIDSYFADKDFGVPQEYILNEVERIRELLRFKYELYLGKRTPMAVRNKIVILTDDGIATGNTILAAIKILRESKAAKIVVAVPVAPFQIEEIKLAADEFISLLSPKNLMSVGTYYTDFSEVNDEVVMDMLNKSVGQFT